MGVSRRTAEFGVPLSFETMNIDATTAEQPTVPAGAKGAVVTVRTNGARWRADGTDPTAAIGHPLSVDDYMEFSRAELQTLSIIGQANPTDVDITYYGD
jgi:hypothetical protein